MLKITSASNGRYKYIKSLYQKKNRVKNKEYTVEGIKSVNDAVKAGADLTAVAVSADFYSKNNCSYTCELLVIDDNIFDKLCDTSNPQGIIAVIKMKDNSDFKPDIKKPYIYCDGVNDPGNLGTIIRTAEAAGFDAVILSENCVDLYNPKTVRSSMGSFFNINVVTGKCTDDLKNYISEGFTLFGGALCDNTIDYRSAEFEKPSIIVVGNEANGISKEVLELCQAVKIPISGRAESLNVSVAAAILMYELFRKRS